MNENPECVVCGRKYDVKEVHRHYGSDHNHKCWVCLKWWRDECYRDPFRVGAGLMRNELPDHVSEAVVKAYKAAFECTKRMLEVHDE